MNALKTFTLLLALGMHESASAKLLQIIHTNDLHSYFNGTREGLGGYARLKTLITQLKADASAKNIKTLIIDAGDFGEGSSFYFSNHGVDSMRALDMLGIDVTILGNHDFILGGRELRRQLLESDLQAKILSANFKGKPLMGLQKLVPNFVDYDYEGMKIRIFGLTTPEIHFQYPIRPLGYISSSHNAGIRQAQKAQRNGVDFLIALTHIGLDRDMKLAGHSRSIDVIFGGHSHTRLERPHMIENLKGELVPVAQTGAHGVAVGSMLVDLHGEGDFTMIDYKLYDVNQTIAKDADVQNFVTQAEVNREKYFNRSWNEVIGFSEITLTGNRNGRNVDGKSCWSRHIARLTKTAAKAQLGLQFDIFQGEEIKPGPIRFGDIIDNFPHFNKWGDQGWNVARATIPGIILKKVIKALAAQDQVIEVTIDGLEALDKNTNMLVSFKMGGVHTVDDARIEGEELSDLKFYSIAIPSEVPRGVGGLSPLIRNLLFSNLNYVDNTYYQPLLEEYIKKNSPLKCLAD